MSDLFWKMDRLEGWYKHIAALVAVFVARRSTGHVRRRLDRPIASDIAMHTVRRIARHITRHLARVWPDFQPDFWSNTWSDTRPDTLAAIAPSSRSSVHP